SSHMSSLIFDSPTALTDCYSLSLHDALPISLGFEVTIPRKHLCCGRPLYDFGMLDAARAHLREILDVLQPDIRAGAPIIGLEPRSEEHTSELQSRENLVCRLLLEKKKKSIKA